MAFSMAEMVSIIPFSGGCYGYVRCTMGHFVGYIIGCIEAIKFIILTAFAVYAFSRIFLEVFEFDDRWLMVIWFGFLSFAVGLKALPFSVVVVIWGVLACGTMAIVAIVIFGSIRHGDVSRLDLRNNTFDSSGTHFLQGVTYSGYFFFGVDVMRTCVYNESNRIVPRALVNITIASSVIAIATVFAVRSYFDEVKVLGSSFFSYSLVLRIVVPTNRGGLIDLFSIAGIAGTALGFFYSGVKQVSSMMGSGFLPFLSVLKMNSQAQIGPSDKFENLDSSEGDDTARKSQSHIGKDPLPENRKVDTDELCALFVCALFIFTVLSGDARYRRGQGLTLLAFLFVCVIYYYWAVQHRQHFNQEEQKMFLKAYIVNANHRRRRGKSDIRKLMSNVQSSLAGVASPPFLSMRSVFSSPRNTLVEKRTAGTTTPVPHLHVDSDLVESVSVDRIISRIAPFDEKDCVESCSLHSRDGHVEVEEMVALTAD
eukprot:scaffold1498_cov180-Ochromonas_danica.AAC.29